METVAFLFFALLTLGGALLALFARSVVNSAFSLMATFFGIAGFFLLLGADFLAVTQVLIYVGGILVLILFGVMLSPIDKKERSLARIGSALVLFGGIAILVGFKIANVSGWIVQKDLPEITRQKPETIPTVVDLGKGFLSNDGYLVPFELAAVVLLVALVGSVYIARRRREIVR